MTNHSSVSHLHVGHPHSPAAHMEVLAVESTLHNHSIALDHDTMPDQGTTQDQNSIQFATPATGQSNTIVPVEPVNSLQISHDIVRRERPRDLDSRPQSNRQTSTEPKLPLASDQLSNLYHYRYSNGILALLIILTIAILAVLAMVLAGFLPIDSITALCLTVFWLTWYYWQFFYLCYQVVGLRFKRHSRHTNH